MTHIIKLQQNYETIYGICGNNLWPCVKYAFLFVNMDRSHNGGVTLFGDLSYEDSLKDE
jgi:hypothetical protein